MDIFKIIEERRMVPILNLKNEKNQIEYIKGKIETNEDNIFFILPNNFFLSSVKDIQLLREELFDIYSLYGIYDLFKLYYPYTQIEFSLFHFSKIKNNQVRFIRLNRKNRLITSEKKYVTKIGSIKEIDYTIWYRNYLLQLEKYVQTNTIQKSDSYIIFHEKNEEIQRDKLYLDYYLPEYRENREKLNQEKIVLLKDIADIVTPKRKKSNTYLKQLLVKDFKYPIDYKELPSTNKVETRLQRNDIVLSTHGKYKVYLYDSDYSDIVPTANSLIIKLRDNVDYNIYYLYNYLSKQIAQKYFSSMTMGSVINYIRKADVQNLPIIKPTEEVLNFSEKEFRLTSNPELVKMSEFNQVINSEWKVDTPIQTEIMAKLFTSIKNTRYKRLKAIIEHDLFEITKCINVGAYKSSIIMCGSVLEGILIDWISETNKYNKYIERAKDNINLYTIIEEFKAITREEYIAKLAHGIRNQRNSVHPKLVYQKGIEFDKDMAFNTLNSLEKIVKKRFKVKKRR